MMKLLVLALLLPLALAFAPMTSRQLHHHRASSSMRGGLPMSKLNEIDELCIESVAEFCLDTDNKIAEGCDVEEYEALVNQLQDQRATLQKHVDYIDGLLEKLQGGGAGSKKEAETYFAG